MGAAHPGGNARFYGLAGVHLDRSLAGWPNEGDAGNGAVMRNLPVVLATLNHAQRFEHWTLEVGAREAREPSRREAAAAPLRTVP